MSYDWIKPGAKYRVVENTSSHKFKIGDAVWWTGTQTLFTNGYEEWYLGEGDIELVNDRTLTVGKTYTSKNGCEWMCISVEGEYAHMRMDGVPTSSAYCFKTDGTNISQCGGDWDVDLGPDRRTINVQGSFVLDDIYDVPMTYHHTLGEHVFNMTIDMVDGKPDWSSAKLTGV